MNSPLKLPESLSEWLDYIQILHPKTIELSLDRVNRVASKLTCLKFNCPVITVAGTNGKGSCVATMASIAQSASLRVGTYTSPHLLRFNERITLLGQPVSDQVLCQAFQWVERIRGEVCLTYFEFTTLAALYILQQADLDLVLLEIGLGGRLDAVNIVNADIAVITSIGFDHQSYLGDSLTQIAGEKAGVMRSGQPVIVGSESAIDLLRPHADRCAAKFIALGIDYWIQIQLSQWEWKSAAGETMSELVLPSFPVENAAAAIVAIKQLNDPRITTADYYRGMAAVNVAARCQTLRHTPLTLLDVAHNVPAAIWLRNQLITRYPNIQCWHAVFACKHDKAVAEIVSIMAEVIDRWYLIELTTPLAMPLSSMTEQFDKLGLAYKTDSDPQTLVSTLQAENSPLDGIIIFGTFMLAELFVEDREANDRIQLK